MYYVDFDPDTNLVKSISPQRQNALAVEIDDELGRKFGDGIENFVNWRVDLWQGKYVFQKNEAEIISNQNIHSVPTYTYTHNYIDFVQTQNKIKVIVQGDAQYKDYIANNDAIINIFVTEKNNPYALLNTMHFMLQETAQDLGYEFDTADISLYMHNPAYTFKHTRR